MPAGLAAWARSYVEQEFDPLVGDPRRVLVQERLGEPGRLTRPLLRSPESIRASAARQLQLGAWRVLVVLLERPDPDTVLLVCEAWQADTRQSLRLVRPARPAFGGTLRFTGALRPEPAPGHPLD